MTGHLSGGDHDRMSRSGIVALPTGDALALFDTAMGSDRPHLLPMRLNIGALRVEGALPPLLRTLVPATLRRAVASAAAPGALAGRLAGLAPEDQRRVVTDVVRVAAAGVLGYVDHDTVDRARTFTALGFDSLTAVEFRNRLANATGLRLPATLVFDHPTPEALSAYLLEQIRPVDRSPVSALLDALDKGLDRIAEMNGIGPETDAFRRLARLETRIAHLRSRDVAHVEKQAITDLSDEEMFSFLSDNLSITRHPEQS